MKVSVVIPTMNGSRFLAPCLDALRATRLPAGSALQIIVVDNGSTDDTPALLSRYSEVKALFLDEPVGFARANNAARQVATGDIVCFLNNDTQVEPGWAERPLEIFEYDPSVSGVGSKLLYMHRFVPIHFSAPVHLEVFLLPEALRDKLRFSRDSRTVYVPLPVEGIDSPLFAQPVVRVQSETPVTACNAGHAPRVLERFPALVAVETTCPPVSLIQNAGNFINDRCEGGDVGSGEEDVPERFAHEEIVPAICGAALWARRSALDEIGWFPDYYTVYYEDVDLCLRLRSRGGKLVFCPSSRVNHYHAGTNRENSPRFIENVSRSSLLFVGRYGDARTIARTVLERVGYAGNELLHGRSWARAPGARGFLSGLAAMPRPLGSRLRDLLVSPCASVSLLGARRRPYPESRL